MLYSSYKPTFYVYKDGSTLYQVTMSMCLDIMQH